MRKKHWHLNLDEGRYFGQVDGEASKERVDFGIKKSNGDLVELGEIELDFTRLALKRQVKILDAKYQLNIFYERPRF